MEISTLFTSKEGFLLDMKIFGDLSSVPSQTMEQRRKDLYAEFSARYPKPTMELKRYEISRAVSDDYRIAYNNAVECLDNESLVNFEHLVESRVKEKLDSIADLPNEVKEVFSYSRGITDSIRDSLIAKYNIATGEDLDVSTHQIEKNFGTVKVDESVILTDEDIDKVLSERVDEDVGVVSHSVEFTEDYDYDEEDDGSEYESEEESDSEAESLDEYEDSDEEDDFYESDDEYEDDEFEDDGSEEDEYEDDSDEEDYDSDEDNYWSEDDDEDDISQSVINMSEVANSAVLATEDESKRHIEADFASIITESKVDSSTTSPTDITSAFSKALADSASEDYSMYEDDEEDLGFTESSGVQEVKIVKEPVKVVEQPSIQPVVTVKPAESVIEEIPKDLRTFLKKNPHCEISVVLKYFTKKEIEIELRKGKIIKRGNTLRAI